MRHHYPLAAHPVWAILASLAACTAGLMGLGVPDHHYQPLFALLVLLLLWHRGIVRYRTDLWSAVLALTHFVLLMFVFKLLIGGGTAAPLAWLQLPSVEMVPAPEDAPWYQRLTPGFELRMRAIPYVSDWRIDITKIQTLLLVATLAGALMRFQPFASLTALALLIFSAPILIAYDWDFVLLFLIFTGLSFYLRSASALEARRRAAESGQHEL